MAEVTESRLINILTIKPHYTIMSSKTRFPYMDSNAACFVFESRAEAEGVMQKFQDVYLSEPEQMRQMKLWSEFWSYGIEKIQIKEDGDPNYYALQITEQKALGSRNMAYNHETCKMLNLIMETNHSGYLRAMKGLPVFSAAGITVRNPKQCPRIRYVYAKTADLKKYFLLFSTLSEFEEWSKQTGGKWKPLETTLRDFGTVRGTDNVVIDPMSRKLILQDFLLKKYVK